MGIGTTKRMNSFTGNYVASAFPYQFKIFTKNDLGVYLRESAGSTEALLIVDTDYTVTGVGEETGGNVTLTAGALGTDSTLSIVRELDIKQELSIRNQDDYYPSVHESAFDKMVMIDQMQQNDLDRSIKLGITNISTVDMTLPAITSTAYGSTLALNDSGTGFTWGPSLTAIDNLDSAAAVAEAAASDALEYSTSAAASASSAAASVSVALAASDYCEDVDNRLAFTLTPVKTSAYTAEWGEVVRCDADAASFTVTMPAADSGSNGHRIGVKKVTATTNTVSVVADGTDEIDDSSSYDMEGAYEALLFVTDGASDIVIIS